MRDFIRSNFFPFKATYKTSDISNLLKSQVVSSSSLNNFEIMDISSLSIIRNNSLVFLEKKIDDKNFSSKNVHIVSDIIDNKNFYENITIVKNLSDSYNKLLNEIYFHDDHIDMQDEFDFVDGSYLSKFAKIHSTSFIGKNCVISRGVEIGKNCIIKDNVTIKNSLIGEDVIICENSSIGTTGFGFNLNRRGSLYLNPQIGTVIIDDGVHIGSCCTIDRGKIDSTYIGKNSMIDNMVHIAHNVIIGNNACIAAQTGISGSVKIGDNVTIGGQVGFAGHINIGENVVIAAKSGVTKNIKDNSVVAGFPATDMREWKKKIIRQRKNGH